MHPVSQHEWVSTLYAGEGSPTGLRNETSVQRFAVYRASLRTNLGQALADTFPVVRRLTGPEFFDAAAHHYIARQPSRHGDIHAYGVEFPDFLAAFEPARSLAYLPDVARLEWLAHEAFHAADAETITLERLADASPDGGLQLHPSLRLLRAEWAVHLIWQANQPEAAGACELPPRGEYPLAVYREADEVAVLPIGAADHECWSRLLAGEPLSDALLYAVDRYPDFDAGASLHRLFVHGLVIQLLTPEEHTT